MRNSCGLFLSLIGVLLVNASGNPVLKVDEEAREKRDAALAWSESLHAFSGAYIRTFVNLDPRKPDPGVLQQSDIIYRFEGEKKYLDFYSYELKNHDRCSLVDGDFTQLFVMESPPEATITSKHFVKYLKNEWKPSWPEEMICPPEYVFQQNIIEWDMSLQEFFAEGHSLQYNREEEGVLIHRRPDGIRVEIKLDTENRISEILWLNDWKEADIEPFTDEEPLDLFFPFSGWHFSSYEKINNIWFPLICEHVFYTGGDHYSSIMQRRNAGEIQPYEAEVEIAMNVQFLEQSIDTIRYDRSSLIINEPLDNDMFEIDVPGDALELDAGGVVIADEISRAWWQKHFVWVIGAGVVLLCAVAGVVYQIRMNAPLK
jgi:hypothetical protein